MAIEPKNGNWDVARRVAGLSPELDGLFEALVGEDYAPGGYGAQHALDPERGEAAVGGVDEVGGVERQDHYDDDRQEGDGDLPHHVHVVGLRQAGHAEQVYDREHGHEHHGDYDAYWRQDRHAA
jgi:hypothetical protein